jgi:hypothetical protein
MGANLRHDDVGVWAINSSRVEYHGVVRFARVACLRAKYGENINKLSSSRNKDKHGSRNVSQ